MNAPVGPEARGVAPVVSAGQQSSSQKVSRSRIDEQGVTELEEARAGHGDERADPTSAPPAASASDPFRLRPRQPQVMRLSRRSVAIVGLALGVCVGGSLIWALKSSASKVAANLYDSASSAKPGVVNGVPADYSQVSRLGAPMIGDLGRPMLSALQRRGHTSGVATEGQAMNQGGGNGPTSFQAAAMERQQRMFQESDSARSSQLFQGDASGSRSIPSAAPSAASEPTSSGIPEVVAGQSNSTRVANTTQAAGSQAGKRSFMETRSVQTAASNERVVTSASPYVLLAGSIIPAALITGIRSDLPGQITAQVTQNVYDSPTGSLLLIPQGARLIGEYDSQVSAGQNRVLLAWDRLILPDGRSIRLERQPGADVSGMAGLQDKTNYHWGNMLKAAFVSTLLGVGTELATQDDSALVQALRYGMQDSINQTGRQLVQRELGVPPTLTVRSGYPLRVIVTRDLIIESVYKEQ